MTLAIAEAQAQVSTDKRSVSVFNAISSRQHITQKMQSVARVPFVLSCLLVAGIVGQDVKPELPEYLTPPTTTQEVITEAPTTTTEVPTTVAIEETTVEVTTVPTETPTIPPTEQPTTIPPAPAEVTTISTTDFTTTTSTTEPTTTTSTTEFTTTTSTTEPTTTTSTTEFTTTTSTTEPTTTTSTTEFTTTTSTTEPTTTISTTTTQSEPIHPTYTTTSTSRRPHYTTKNPWSWNEPKEQCYLKEQHEYIKNCWGYGWTPSFSCYRCCYYPNSNFAGCSRLHRGRCWWYD